MELAEHRLTALRDGAPRFPPKWVHLRVAAARAKSIASSAGAPSASSRVNAPWKTSPAASVSSIGLGAGDAGRRRNPPSTYPAKPSSPSVTPRTPPSATPPPREVRSTLPRHRRTRWHRTTSEGRTRHGRQARRSSPSRRGSRHASASTLPRPPGSSGTRGMISHLAAPAQSAARPSGSRDLALTLTFNTSARYPQLSPVIPSYPQLSPVLLNHAGPFPVFQRQPRGSVASGSDPRATGPAAAPGGCIIVLPLVVPGQSGPPAPR